MDTNSAQTILSNIGLLDPPADGVIGPVTRWALEEFCRRENLPLDSSLDSEALAEALTSAKPLPLTPGDDLAGRIVSAIIAKGYWVARHPECLNIAYVEGTNADGSPNGNLPNEFNDRRMVIRIGSDGVPKIEGSWEGTTEPGRQYTEHPLNVRGAARVAFGQHKAWSVGDYHGWESLLQAAPIPVYRDLAQHYKREGSPDIGMFGIHQHRGYDLPKNDIGPSSAGCLIGRTNAGHREFMALLKTDARYRANPNYRFITALLPVEALAGVSIRSPSVVPSSSPAFMAKLTQDTVAQIAVLADRSEVARHKWGDDRGIAPPGYIKGMAVTFGYVYSKWKAGDSATRIMAGANTGNDSTDALSWYDSQFRSQGMSNAAAGADTLRHLFVLLMGLGMRESSGRYCEGRDCSASNLTADTAEAGLFQMSWNACSASPELPKLFAAYSANPEGFLSVFQEGVRCTESDLADYGTGAGAEFQRLCKSCPAFAVEAAAVGLRLIRRHWGPINRHDADIVTEADTLFRQVQNLIDGVVEVAATAGRKPVETATAETTRQQESDVSTLALQIQALHASMQSVLGDLAQIKNTGVAGPAPASPQIDVAQLEKQMAALRERFKTLSRAGVALPTATPATLPVSRLSPIDKALGGQAMVGLKTPIAILAYAGLWIMQAFDAVGPATGAGATPTAQVLTALIAGFGGLGLTAKVDRGIQAMNAVAASAQTLLKLNTPE
jgi:hypothetical protein